MNNCYITTGFGFIKGVAIDKTTNTRTIEYTDKLRYALAFNSKGAKAFLLKYDVVGFIYNPFAQEAVRNMYEVKKRYSYGFEENTDTIQEWQVMKAIMINESDANFLQSRKLASRDLLSYADACVKAIELNQIMLNELQSKLNKQVHEFTTHEPDDIMEEIITINTEE